MTDKEQRLTIWYEEMDGSDYPLVGKKNANLGEMIKAGIPVAPGFAITVHANDKFITDTGIKTELAKKLPELGEVTYETAKEASDFAIKLMEAADLPRDLEESILSTTGSSAVDTPAPPVLWRCGAAVRSRCRVKWRLISTFAARGTSSLMSRNAGQARTTPRPSCTG